MGVVNIAYVFLSPLCAVIPLTHYRAPAGSPGRQPRPGPPRTERLGFRARPPPPPGGPHASVKGPGARRAHCAGAIGAGPGQACLGSKPLTDSCGSARACRALRATAAGRGRPSPARPSRRGSRRLSSSGRAHAPRRESRQVIRDEVRRAFSSCVWRPTAAWLPAGTHLVRGLA